MSCGPLAFVAVNNPQSKVCRPGPVAVASSLQWIVRFGLQFFCYFNHQAVAIHTSRLSQIFFIEIRPEFLAILSRDKKTKVKHNLHGRSNNNI